MLTQTYMLKQHTHTHTYYTHTNTTEQVNSADFPCQLLGRHWFKETSICDVSTYLMNPHRSMEGLVCYTVHLHSLAHFYSNSDYKLNLVTTCPGASLHVCIWLHSFKKTQSLLMHPFNCVSVCESVYK